MQVTITGGDATQTLKALPDNSQDATFCDPPYGLTDLRDVQDIVTAWAAGTAYTPKRKKGGFMGQSWDAGVPDPTLFRELHRTLKPGAMGLIACGTRTTDLMGLSLRLAGFDVLDIITWHYGSGFPHGQNVSKAIDKRAGAERPVVGQGMSGESRRVMNAAHTPESFGGAYDITAPATEDAVRWDGYNTQLKPATEMFLLIRKPTPLPFADNALTHGCGALNVKATAVGTETVKTHGVRTGSGRVGAFADNYSSPADFQGTERTGRYPTNLLLGEEAGAAMDAQAGGNPSRFFYCPKASQRERDEGLGKGGNTHPTIKPLALNAYLSTLLLPPPRADGQPRQLVIPFSGSGSEIIGALQAGWDTVNAFELSQEFVDISVRRLAFHTPDAAVQVRGSLSAALGEECAAADGGTFTDAVSVTRAADPITHTPHGTTHAEHGVTHTDTVTTSPATGTVVTL